MSTETFSNISLPQLSFSRVSWIRGFEIWADVTIISLKVLLTFSSSVEVNTFFTLLVTVGGIMSLVSAWSSRVLWTRCSSVSCSEGRSKGSVAVSCSYRHYERTLSNTRLGLSFGSSGWPDIFDLTISKETDCWAISSWKTARTKFSFAGDHENFDVFD